MLEICINNVRVAIENLKQTFASPAGIFIYAALSGIIGIVIVLAFFSLIFADSALPLALPFIISFNAATSGFCLVDKSRMRFPYLRISLFVLSGMLAVTGCISIAVLLPWESMMDGTRYVVSGLSALIFSFFGAWIGSESKTRGRTSL